MFGFFKKNLKKEHNHFPELRDQVNIEVGESVYGEDFPPYIICSSGWWENKNIYTDLAYFPHCDGDEIVDHITNFVHQHHCEIADRDDISAIFIKFRKAVPFRSITTDATFIDVANNEEMRENLKVTLDNFFGSDMYGQNVIIRIPG